MVAMKALNIETPLGGGLLFYQISGQEELGRLFEYDIELLSEDPEVDFSQVLGQAMTVEIETEGEPRFIRGIVTSFSDVGTLGSYSRYRAKLRPWLWLLTRKSDCRIFQDMTAPDIIKEVLREHAITFSESLTGSYTPREYCAQYRETDFDFVSRLMEEEGIYYFFEHTQSKLTVVLADSIGAHDPTPGYDEIPFYPKVDRARRERDHIDGWVASQHIASGAYFLQDFDFERPDANLQVKLVSSNKLTKPAHEIYDYPGIYDNTGAGENLVRVRLEELHTGQNNVTAEGNARGLATGALFSLTEFPRDDQNKEYLVVSSQIEATGDGYETGGIFAEPKFRCSFVAMDSNIPFRPARQTPRPIVQGPQTAIVVGKSGEDIWTDAHGRVKVQFHWDRLGKVDEGSSCWVRVAQASAGKEWGGVQIPRIGHEVVVNFLEGNPDRPLITGSVYNSSNKPPYGLPPNQTQSGIKTRSSKGGNADNFNEIRLEDKKGSEQIFIQAEKDFELLVKNDRKKTIQHDEITIVENDRTETVEHNEKITIKGSRHESVHGNETIAISGKREETVKGDETIAISGKRTEEVKGDEKITIGGKLNEVIGGDVVTLIGGKFEQTVGIDMDIVIAGKLTEAVSTDVQLVAGGVITLLAGGKLTLVAGDQLVLKCGGATITLKKSGVITIKGTKIDVKGSGPVNVKSSAALSLAGSAIKIG